MMTKEPIFFRFKIPIIVYLKIFDHYDSTKIIIVSLIDNLVKGAAGQAVQSFNVSHDFEEKFSFGSMKLLISFIFVTLLSCSYPDIDSVPNFKDLKLTDEELFDLCELSSNDKNEIDTCIKNKRNNL